MVAMAEDIFYIIFGLSFLLVVVWLILVSRYFSYLKVNFPSDYEMLGKPSLLKNNTPSSNLKFFKYIWSNKVYTHGDGPLSSKTTTLRLILGLVFLCFVAMLTVLPISRRIG